jgi:protein-S-isoprenylcysteine O-methyltransferase
MSDTTDTTSPSQDERPERYQNGGPRYPAASSSIYISPQYLSGGARSLSGISIRAYGLGIALGFCSLLASQLAYFGYTIWRAPAFIAVLAVFHYLEFDMTARYNPPDAGTASFLLLSNGMAYTVAHGTAMSETLFRHLLQSQYKPDWLAVPFANRALLPTVPHRVPVGLGFFLIFLGQLVRSVAMRQARTNFNHIVQFQKKEDHVLVTNGVYALSRHPSYFGFFWWALGTQLMLGNHLSFLAYAVILWEFFSHRIMRESTLLKWFLIADIAVLDEERHLVAFFGQSYQDYRRRTPVLIPFVG